MAAQEPGARTGLGIPSPSVSSIKQDAGSVKP